MKNKKKKPVIQYCKEDDKMAVVQPLAQYSMFRRPKFLNSSNWLNNIPFAFWLVEAFHPKLMVELGTGCGSSYFAFCQSIERLNIDARCYAVDNWAAKQLTEEFSKIDSYNNDQYQEFSSLLNLSDEEAVKYFDDNSIDLLNINTACNYKQAQKLFEIWYPKLTKNAILLIHGTQIRSAENDIYKLFINLKKNHSNFELLHSKGLGVIGFGNNYNNTLQRLFDLDPKDSTAAVLQTIFSRLGIACSATYISDSEKKRAESLHEKLIESQINSEKLSQSLDEYKSLNRLQKNEIEEINNNKKTETDSQIEALNQQLKIRFKELAKLTELLEERDKRINSLDENLKSQKEKHIKAIEKIQATHKDELDIEKTQLQSKSNEIEKLTKFLSERDSRIDSLEKDLLSQKEAHNKKIEENQSTYQAELESLNKQLEIRFEELAKLTMMLEEKDNVSNENNKKFIIKSSSSIKRKKLKNQIKLVKASGLFDKKWYLKNNADVAKAGLNPLAHFIQNGGIEGRSPSVNFDSEWYLSEHFDVKEAGVNPLIHYIQFGKSEGRTIKAVADSVQT